MQKRIVLIVLLFTMAGLLHAQDVMNCNEIHPEGDYDNIHIKKIDTDKNSTSFIIWVRNAVKAHKHVHHTETLYVLSGAGKMKIGEKEYDIKEGDYINVPENTVHSVVVTSEDPLKVISIQAPEFLGKDRIFVE